MSNSVAVSFRNITKSFGDFKANDNVSFDIESNKVHAIVGENGAGKSTIVKILYGFQQTNKGSISINGQPVKIENSEKALRLGIGMVHQHFMLVNAMTVLENILIGNANLKYGSIINFNKTIKHIKAKSEQYKLHFNLDEYIKDLSVGTKQRLEIFKAILRETKILILDEPTSVLTKLEVADLFKIIKKLQQKNHTIIIISHKLDEVMEISDNITVMRAGKVIETLKKEETTIENLAGLMVGKKIPPPIKPETKLGDVVLEIKNLNYTINNKQIINDLNLSVSQGEILGIAGISGNAQNELEQILTGMINDKSSISGTIKFNGVDITNKNALEKRSLGISHIPSDRTKWGYIQEWSNRKNGILGYQFFEKFNNFRYWLKYSEIVDFVVNVLKKYKVVPAELNAMTKKLSGGNQQKLIVGREFETDPKLLIIAEPTNGVDIGSVAFIHQQILDTKKQNKAVLLISSELNEIKELADRSYVINHGSIVGNIDWQKDDEQKIGLMMIGKISNK